MNVEDNPYIRLSTLDDPFTIGPKLRKADISEIKAASGRLPSDALMRGVLNSRPCYTAITPDGEPSGMFGVVPADKNTGIIWALFTDNILNHRKEFMRVSRQVVEECNNQYALLTNVVDARNTVHVRWLRKLGFVFLREIEEYGYEKRKFYEFVRYNKHV